MPKFVQATKIVSIPSRYVFLSQIFSYFLQVAKNNKGKNASEVKTKKRSRPSLLPDELSEHKTRNELKPVWVSLRDKISLRCEVTSGVVKLTSVQISLRWFEISNHFEMSFPLHGNLHRDFAAASFQTIARPYCTCANDIF